MPILTLITWNMQGGNDDKWSRIFDTGAPIKCLQECAKPHSQFKDGFGKAFAETSDHTVELSYVASHAPRYVPNASVANVKPAINYGSANGHVIRVTKFAAYGDALAKRYRRQVDKVDAERADHELALDKLLKTPGHDPKTVEQLRYALDLANLARRKLEQRIAEVASPRDLATGAYRHSRCNMTIACREDGFVGDASWMTPLAPAKPEFQRHIQCLRVDFGMDGRLVIFNIHSVASGAAWSYLRSFIPQFDSIATDEDAVAWLCLGDFNLDAPTMTDKINGLTPDQRYPCRRVIYSEGVATHFSKTGDPDEDETEEEDRDVEEESRDKMSEMIRDNSPTLTTLKGRNLDYMIMSARLELPETATFPCMAGVEHFLSDHRPVEFTINTAHFRAIQAEIMRVAEERAEWIKNYEKLTQMRKEMVVGADRPEKRLGEVRARFKKRVVDTLNRESPKPMGSSPS